MTARTVGIGLCTAALAAVPAGPAWGAPTNLEVARSGAGWLRAQPITTPGQQADAIVALAAAGTARSVLLARLSTLAQSAPTYGNGAGSAGKVVLAAVAAGGNPRSLGGVNYVARIKATYRDGAYGSGTYDQAYAILALRAAGEQVPIRALRRVTGARGTGGWGYRLSRSARDDISATGLMIQALRAGGLSHRHGGLMDATAWMVSRRNSSGGYAIDGGNRPTEANATAIAICALRAMRRPLPTRSITRLRRLQESDGGFRFTVAVRGNRVMASVDAVVALAGRSLPVR